MQSPRLEMGQPDPVKQTACVATTPVSGPGAFNARRMASAALLPSVPGSVTSAELETEAYRFLRRRCLHPCFPLFWKEGRKDEEKHTAPQSFMITRLKTYVHTHLFPLQELGCYLQDTFCTEQQRFQYYFQFSLVHSLIPSCHLF